MHKIDLSHNRIKISKLLTIQVVMMLFAILFTYKWAVNYVDIIEQRFLTNVIYGILGFIGVLIIHELIHKCLFLFFLKDRNHNLNIKMEFCSFICHLNTLINGNFVQSCLHH